MPSSEYTVNILIKSKDQTSKPATNAKNSLETLRKAASLAAGAFAVLKTAQKAVEFVKWGAKIDRAAKSLDAMARSAGTSGDAIINSIRFASDFQIDRMGAMEAANKAMLMEVASTPAEFEKLATVAVKLGRVMGVDAAGSMDRFVVASARKSIKIADDLGLTISATDANEKYAKANNLLATELTAAQQSQAFFNEMMEQGERKLATLGEQTANTADKIDTVSGALKTVGQVFGEEFAVSLGEAMTGTRDFAEMLAKAEPGIRAFAATAAAMISPSTMPAAIDAWKEALNAMFNLGAGTEEAATKISGYNGYIGDGISTMHLFGTATREAGTSTDDLITDMEATGPAIQGYGKNTMWLTELLAEQKLAAEGVVLAQLDLSQALADATDEQFAQAAINELKTAYDEGKITIDEYKTAVTQVQGVYGLTTPASIRLAEGITALTTQLADGEVQAGDYDSALKDLTDRANKYSAAIYAIPDSKATYVDVVFRRRDEGQAAAEEKYGSAIPGMGVPNMASGGTARGGTVMVGELGPERVRLPRGSQVTPASQTTNNYKFEQTVNTRATQHSIMNDFALAEALAA